MITLISMLPALILMACVLAGAISEWHITD